MKKKILVIIYIFLIIITIKLFYNFFINSILINQYNNGQYSDTQAKMLTFLNFPQSYVANYNYGNILYQNGKYEEAIEQYQKALSGIVPQKAECSIRINYALAICKTVQVDETDQNSIQTAIDTYETAIEVLTEKGCANKNDNNGHSLKAEQLKQDIQNEIDRLKKLKQEPNEPEEKPEEDKPSEKPEDIKTKIQEIKGKATQEQKKEEDFYKNYGNFNYDKPDKNW